MPGEGEVFANALADPSKEETQCAMCKNSRLVTCSHGLSGYFDLWAGQ